MKHCFAAILMAMCLISCVNENIETMQPEHPQTSFPSSEDAFVKGECVVFFSTEVADAIEESLSAGFVKTKSADIDAIFTQIGVESARRLFPHAGEFEPRTRKEGLHRWYVLEYSEQVTYTKVDQDFRALPGVEIVEPVRKIKVNDYAFNDLTSELWGLDNVEYPEYDINVQPVWENYTTGSSDVIVSVVDNGVEIRHPDLADNCLKNGHYNAVDNSTTIYPGDHGTHVAGTIAAVGNNHLGIVGIAGGDKAKGQAGVKILSCQIFKDSVEGQTTGSSAAAIKYGADNGAVISQNSWGYVYDANNDGNLTGNELKDALESTVLKSDKDAIDYFIKYAGCDNDGNQLPNSPMKGGVVIFAAGNDNIANGAPANYDKVIAVGSIAKDGTKSSFSNYGPWVDVCAPGTGILSTVTGGAYESMNGTSMACPHVSGVAALIVSYHGGPGFTCEMLKEKLLMTVNTELVPSSYQVGGLVDAYGAMTYGTDAAPAAVTDLDADTRANTLDLTWTVTADDEGVPAYGFLVLYSTDRQKLEDATAANYKAVDYAVCTPGLSKGEKVEFSVKGLDFESEYYVKVLAYSYGRNYADPSDVVKVTTTVNNAPTVENEYEGSYQIKGSETMTVPFVVSDPDGHAVEVECETDAVVTFAYVESTGRYLLTVVGKDNEEGPHGVTITAEDEYGMVTVYEFEFTITPNAAPVQIKPIDDVFLTSKGKEVVIDMLDHVSDPDGEQLKYTIANTNEKVANVTSRGDKMYITALSYGLAEIVITAADVRGNKVEFSFSVLIKNPSSPLSVYPNPVTDFVNIGTLESAMTQIRIYSSTGELKYDETSEVSGMDPARVDMSGYAPGIYSVKVSFNDKEYSQTVVKL